MLVALLALLLAPAAARTASAQALVELRFELARVPASTPRDAQLTLATNLTGWDPAHECCRFVRAGRRYVLSLRVPRGALLEYKLARGSWATVETQNDGAPRANRTLDALQNARVRLEVERWADDPGPRPEPRSTVSGRVVRLADVESPELGNRRDVWVALPPGYDESERRYPVLYMQDGQNAFDQATAFRQREWRADEAAQQQAHAGHPVIVVAVASETQPEGAGRLSEYAPWPVPERGDGLGPAYVAFLAGTLKPLIDARFRSLPERDATGLCGSSMGGLISLYGALSRPDVFGFAAVHSPSLWWADEAVFPWLLGLPRATPLRVFLDIGDREGATLEEAATNVARVERLGALLRGQGHAVRLRIGMGGRHNEDAWAERFPEALAFFLESRQ